MATEEQIIGRLTERGLGPAKIARLLALRERQDVLNRTLGEYMAADHSSTGGILQGEELNAELFRRGAEPLDEKDQKALAASWYDASHELEREEIARKLEETRAAQKVEHDRIHKAAEMYADHVPMPLVHTGVGCHYHFVRDGQPQIAWLDEAAKSERRKTYYADKLAAEEGASP